MTPEAKVQRDIIEEFGRHHPVWRQQAGRVKLITGHWMELAPKGAADLTSILPNGCRLEIEVKSDTGRQSDDQKNWQKMITSRNGIYVLARSVEDVWDAIRRYQSAV